MRAVKSILILIIFCFTSIATAQSIAVNDAYTAQQLVGNVLVKNSSCASTSNAIATGDTFTPAKKSYAYFNNQGGSFPFAEGIILSSWSSSNSAGPFDATNKGDGSLSWKGDTDLEQALNITNTFNATVLEFDFVSLTNLISFNYLFASNEYQENFPCNYSDGFAFLIKEIGTTTYQNLAVIPGTTTPVSSKNVRPLIPDFNGTTGVKPGCPALNQAYFGGLNTSTTNSSPINYSGQSVVMNAQANVVVGKMYHIKLVIADQGGNYYDSAVFLQAGSFAPKIDLGPDQSLTTNNPVCFGESYTIDTKLPATYNYKWFKNNVEITGKTDPFLTITDSGTYKVEVLFTPGTCIASDEIKIEYAPEILLSDATLVQCDDNNDGKTNFDLTKVDKIITNDASLSLTAYYESLPDAKKKINPILIPTNYQNQSVNQIVFARVTNSFGCANYAKVTLQISNNSVATQSSISTCDGDAVLDGLSQFDLNAQVTQQLLAGLPNGLVVEYYLNSGDAISQKNPLSNIFKNTTPNQQIIYARIVNGPDCYGITPITLVVNTFDPPNFQDETTGLCDGSSVNISVNVGFSTYLWNTGGTSNTLTVSAPGNYSVIVTDAKGCSKTKKFTVAASGIATITGATINDFAGNNNSIQIQYTGLGNYEFSLDGTNFQDNPLFTGIAAGTYWAFVRDKNGCGISTPLAVYFLDYPRYFTPNGDGFNDVWEIKNLGLLPAFTLTIFDRYGKLLNQLDATSSSWNGTFNGILLPASDYWFNLALENGKIIKGHFSLKR